MERGMVVVVCVGRTRGRRNEEAMGWVETSFARERSDRETDEKKMHFCTNVGGRVGRHQLLLRGEGFGATTTRLV